MYQLKVFVHLPFPMSDFREGVLNFPLPSLGVYTFCVNSELALNFTNSKKEASDVFSCELIEGSRIIWISISKYFDQRTE